jgi:hypothetical protein
MPPAATELEAAASRRALQGEFEEEALDAACDATSADRQGQSSYGAPPLH